jgi:hypothetical protein
MRPSGLAPADASHPVKVAIKTADADERVAFHYGRMQCIARHQVDVTIEERASPIHNLGRNWDDYGKQGSCRIVNLPALWPTLNCPVAVQDLLQHLGIDAGIHVSLSDSHKEGRAPPFVRMRGACSVHEDVRIHQDHGAISSGRGIDSRFIRRGEATGNRRAANA